MATHIFTKTACNPSQCSHRTARILYSALDRTPWQVTQLALSALPRSRIRHTGSFNCVRPEKI
jgi:hypothetical protein